MQGARVRSLVRELDPTCMLQLKIPHAATKRSCMPQLNICHAATKILHATTKTWRSQINYFFKLFKKKYWLIELEEGGDRVTV